MRKLKLQVQMSIDGYIAGQQGEMDWLVRDWDEELKRYVTALTEPVGCILLGRRLAEGFIPHWAAVAADPAHPEHAAGRKFSETPKVLFSRTLDRSPWENTRLAKDGLAAEVSGLKRQAGGDLIAYGGAAFVSSLIEQDLIDEYHFFINPALLGDGLPIFRNLPAKRELSLVQASRFACGIVVLHYEPGRAAAS